mgnify:CR=1 FL=1
MLEMDADTSAAPRLVAPKAVRATAFNFKCVHLPHRHVCVPYTRPPSPAPTTPTPRLQHGVRRDGVAGAAAAGGRGAPRPHDARGRPVDGRARLRRKRVVVVVQWWCGASVSASTTAAGTGCGCDCVYNRGAATAFATGCAGWRTAGGDTDNVVIHSAGRADVLDGRRADRHVGGHRVLSADSGRRGVARPRAARLQHRGVAGAGSWRRRPRQRQRKHQCRRRRQQQHRWHSWAAGGRGQWRRAR